MSRAMACAARNTDGSGFVEACGESGVSFAGARVLLIGAGGAATAIASAVLGAGARGVRVLNRTKSRAEKLRDKLRAVYPEAELSVHADDNPEEVVSGTDVIVNATYLGINEGDPLPLPVGCLRPGMVVCDAVYRPGGETKLVRRAKERGLRVIPGERMLLYQGVQAQRIWTGKEPDTAAMSEALS